MDTFKLLIAAAVTAALVAGTLATRSTLQKNRFDRLVKEAHKTSEGYDQRLIDMVNRLEYELALRASFGYSGQKDPMTGRERMVVARVAPARRPSGPAPVTEAPSPPPVDIDSVKLTALIFDDVKKVFTAIVMVNDRSFAIETGDMVVGRKVVAITADRVVLETAESVFIYEINGRRTRRDKVTPAIPPVPGTSGSAW